MPSDDLVQALVLSCLERMERMLNDLDRLAADRHGDQQRQRIHAEMRRELEAAEAAIRKHEKI